jgi:hypothetical protein
LTGGSKGNVAVVAHEDEAPMGMDVQADRISSLGTVGARQKPTAEDIWDSITRMGWFDPSVETEL